MRLILPRLPAIVIILVVEHIAISKAMGRLHNYAIDPSQEVVAIGFANLSSPFVGGYVCTGSFGASAVLSKAGVQTPLAGVFGATVLVLALYALTNVFYYIPKAALAGLIIHSVCNLVAQPSRLYKYWQLSPIEFLIWLVAITLAIFDNLETSIYAGIVLSLALLLVRMARSKGQFLGCVRVQPVGDIVSRVRASGHSSERNHNSDDGSTDIFLPLDRSNASNPDIRMTSAHPGVFIYRFSESYNYTNQAQHMDILLRHIMQRTARTSEEHFEKHSDRLWNDPGPRQLDSEIPELPHLRAVVLDFAAVNNMDVTSVQGLVDLRNTLDRYAAPDSVEWHFANVHNRWTRRTLAVAGFGYPTSQNPEALEHWKPIYGIAALGSDVAGKPDIENRTGIRLLSETGSSDRNQTTSLHGSAASTSETPPALDMEARRHTMAAVFGVDRPFFHMDLHDAINSAVTDAESKQAHR